MRAGFLGLGAMGAHMARNLHKAGLLGGVWNRTPAKAAALAAQVGCDAAADPADLAQRCDSLVLCVSADADVLEVVRALLPAIRPGTLVIDCSTVSADTARSAAAMLAARGAAFLDCPVSGGVEGAERGTLAIMCGGPEADFERARPLLQAMGRTVSLFGAHGAGQAAKATNQIMCAGIIRTVAEAMAFARAQRLPLTQVVETLGQGAGSSWYFVHRAPNMIRGTYPPGFRVRLHEKDLRICRDMAAASGVSLPVVEDMLREYGELIRRGFGDEDISAIYRLKQELFDNAPFRNPPLEEILGLLGRVRTIAMVGLSADPSRPSHGVARGLQRHGWRVIPVTPAGGEILGERCVATLDEVGSVLGSGERIDLVDVFRRPEHVAGIVDDCIRLGLPALWLQDGVIDEAAARRARGAGIFTVMDRCTLRDCALLERTPPP
jgi:3-hydroxyisobutyrate dehydrogenase